MELLDNRAITVDVRGLARTDLACDESCYTASLHRRRHTERKHDRQHHAPIHRSVRLRHLNTASGDEQHAAVERAHVNVERIRCGEYNNRRLFSVNQHAEIAFK